MLVGSPDMSESCKLKYVFSKHALLTAFNPGETMNYPLLDFL